MAEILDSTAVKWVPTSVARRRLGVSKQRVYQLIQTGGLAGGRIDGIMMVSSRSIEDRLLSLKRGG